MKTPTKEQIEIKDPCDNCEFGNMIIPSCLTPCNEKIRFLYKQYNKERRNSPK